MPIALWNVIIKIDTKNIASIIIKNCLRIIGDNHTDFIHNRLTNDNINIAFEIFHFLNKTNNRKKKHVGIKMDMAKAYVRLEWNFINHMPLAMRFPSGLTKTLMNCISTIFSPSWSMVNLLKPLTPLEGSDKGILFPLFVYNMCRCALKYFELIPK